MTRVILDGLVKRFDRVAVVDGATLEIDPGTLVTVVGPSGAGKTTLARLVAGLDRPDAGEIYFNGRVMQDVPAPGRRVGLVFQDDALWPHLTVAENVGLALRVKKIGRQERRRAVAEALEAARVETLADRRPDGLSGLQRQRVALARALAVEPDLLILDEPLSRLEDRARDEFRDELLRWHAETKTTTLVLTNHPREALTLGGRLAVMDLGRITQSGPAEEVYHHPADAFVAQFLGPTNLLPGRVEAHDPRGALVVKTAVGRLVGRASAAVPPPGSPALVAIRPESLAPGSPAALVEVNRVAAAVERIQPRGDRTLIHLLGPARTPLLAVALPVAAADLRAGLALTLTVPPDRVTILPSQFAVPPDAPAEPP